MKQKGTGRNNSNAKAGSGREISQVVRDNRVGLTRDCKLDHHVVVRIPEQRTPQEENFLLVRNEAQVINE